MRAPPRVKEHRVARRRVDVRDADHSPGPSGATSTSQPRVTIWGTVSPPSRLYARRPGELADGPAVVAAISDLQMAQRVEVRAELLRARYVLRDPVDAVAAQAALVDVMGGADERLAEVASGEGGDGLVEDLYGRPPYEP